MSFKLGLATGAFVVSVALILMVGNELQALFDPRSVRQPPKADGSHCLRRNPREHVGFMDAINARINRKDRVVTQDTRIGPLREDGTHTITVDYRFRKAGVFTDGRATGTLRNDDCSIEIQTLER